MSDLDCPTTDPAIFAKCKCGHTSKGTKYCDIEGGDEEWTEAYSFVSFYRDQILFSLRNTLREATIVTRPKVLVHAIIINTIITGNVPLLRLNYM